MMNKLRVGVILPYVKVPVWVARMLESIKDSSHAEVTAMAFADRTGGKEDFAAKLYTFHFQTDQRMFHPTPNPWERRDVRKILQNTQLLGENLNERIARLKAMRLDVLLNLSLEDLPKSLLDVARFGVWSLRCNDKRVTTSTQFGWLETLRDESLLHCTVETYRNDSTQVVAESVMAVHPYSFTHNQKLFLWRMSDLLPRALKQLYSQGEREFFARAKSVNQPGRYSKPTTSQLLTLAWKQMGKLFENKLWREWFPYNRVLMAGIRPEGESFTWDRFKPQVPPRGARWSDPFILKKQGISHLFFEEYIHAKKGGHISYAVIESDGSISGPLTALERPYHLSYPFIFEYRGEFYMIPATTNHAIEVYRCTRFPDQWEFHKTIMCDVSMVNATLIENLMRWWMFACMDDELHLFYTDDPLSEKWTPHPMNPIVSDIRSAGPAGRIFRRDGGLVRPARDSSLRHGRAVSFYHITKLTTNEYEEELIERIEPPNENILAVRTYSQAGELTVVDVILK
jgi:hypothetical protein